MISFDSEVCESKTFLAILTNLPEIPTPSIRRWSPPTGRIWQYELPRRSHPLSWTVETERWDREASAHIFQPFITSYERTERTWICFSTHSTCVCPITETLKLCSAKTGSKTPVLNKKWLQSLTFYSVCMDANSCKREISPVYLSPIIQQEVFDNGDFQDKVSIWPAKWFQWMIIFIEKCTTHSHWRLVSHFLTHRVLHCFK